MIEFLKKNKLASALLTAVGIGGGSVATALPWDKLLPSLVTKSHLEQTLTQYKRKDGIPDVVGIQVEPEYVRRLEQKIDHLIDLAERQ